jgi:hypothetical protein
LYEDSQKGAFSCPQRTLITTVRGDIEMCAGGLDRFDRGGGPDNAADAGADQVVATVFESVMPQPFQAAGPSFCT